LSDAVAPFVAATGEAGVAPHDAAPSGASAPLRIVHVFRAPLGGLFRHVLDLTRAQLALGHSVGLVADSTTGGPASERLLAELAPSLALGIYRIPMRRAPHPSDVPVFGRIARHLRRVQPNVVHGHGSKGGLYARLDGFLPFAPAAVRGYTPHGGSFNQRPGSASHRLYMLVEKFLAQRTDILLFESAFIADRFDTFVGTVGAQRRIVPNGIGAAEFVPVPPNPDAAEFLYVGELRAAKGIDTLLVAFAQLCAQRRPRPRLALVGSGPDTDSLRRQALELGVAEQVDFLGVMPARAAFSLGRVLVVPSRAESLPYIVLEAAGARIPMVATNVGGIPEIFGPSRDRLVPSDDAGLLAAAMRAELDGDPARVAEKAAVLARYVESQFSYANMVDAVVGGYRSALAQKHRALVTA
jgi:glycosyltransferase involved in cell wall biosynthesis